MSEAARAARRRGMNVKIDWKPASTLYINGKTPFEEMAAQGTLDRLESPQTFTFSALEIADSRKSFSFACGAFLDDLEMIQEWLAAEANCEASVLMWLHRRDDLESVAHVLGRVGDNSKERAMRHGVVGASCARI